MSEPTNPEAAGVPTMDGAARTGHQPGGAKKERNASLWADAWRDLSNKPTFWISTILVLLVVSMAVWPSLWTSVDPNACDVNNSKGRPSADHIFGFNDRGCDFYSTTIYGARASIKVALLATIGTTVFGGLLGILAAYYGGWADAIISRLTDVVLGLPFLLGAIVLLSLLRSQFTDSDAQEWALIAVLITLGWTSVVRIMRASVMSTKNMDYVQAARALGASDFRLIARHILPNAIAPVIVIATIALGSYVAAEATLTYLGVGLQAPSVSWGISINDGQNRVSDYPHLLLFPCGFLVATVLSFIMLGDALRDALDPKLR
jgi:ABC-type dipeptide/oligopeptide/nickel transport system permease subunit